MYSAGRSMDGTMSPMPAKWITRCTPLKNASSGA
jgi:hypothetical protein